MFGAGSSATFQAPEPPLSNAVIEAINHRADLRVGTLQLGLQSALGKQLNTQLSAGMGRLTTAAQAETRLLNEAASSSLRSQQHQAQQVLRHQAGAQVSAARAHLANWLQREIQTLSNAHTAELIGRDIRCMLKVSGS